MKLAFQYPNEEYEYLEFGTLLFLYKYCINDVHFHEYLQEMK